MHPECKAKQWRLGILLRLLAIGGIILFATNICQAQAINSSQNKYNNSQFMLASTDLNALKTSYLSIWPAIRDHLTMTNYYDQPAVKQAILWYTSHPKDLDKLYKNSVPLLSYMYQLTQQKHLPAELALLPMVESAYHPTVHSHAGAVGLWQLMPGTARDMHIKINYWSDGRKNIAESTNAAFNYLVRLYNYFGDWTLALAAYNDGPGLIYKHMRYNLSKDLGAGYWHLHIPHETQTYLPRLLAFAAIVRNPNYYHVHLPDIEYAPTVTTILVSGQINLTQLSLAAGLNKNKLRQLNSGWNYAVTSPGQEKYLLMVPTNCAKKISNLLQNMHFKKWVRVTYRRATTINKISLATRVSANKIRAVNNFSKRRNIIHAKTNILIPTSKTVRVHTYPQTNETTHMQNKGDAVVYPTTAYDTLQSIAQKFSVTQQDIIKWNHMRQPAHLSPLQTLLIFNNSHNKQDESTNQLQNILSQISG